MKNTKSYLCLIFLSISLLYSCSNTSANEDEIIGTYIISFSDLDMHINQLEMNKPLLNSFIITLKKEGKLGIKVSGSTGTGTYKLKGTELLLNIKGDLKKAKLVDDKIYLESGSMDLVFIKKNKKD